MPNVRREKMMEEALKQLDKPASASKKFKMGLLGLVLMAVIAGLCIWRNTDPALAATVMGWIFMLVGGYVGSTSWQEKAVRLAAVQRGPDE
jgi:hypothetical protein